MKRILPLLFTAALLTACTQGEVSGTAQPTLPEPLAVNLQVSETGTVNEAVNLSAIVTQGTEVVTDADEVEFEVWQEGQKESSNLLPASHEGEGKYAAETTFTEAGVYFIQSHVTARDMHTMPETTITISEKEAAAEEAVHQHSHAAHGTVAIHLMEAKMFRVNEPAVFTVHVQKEEVLLTGADVTLEIWQEGSEKFEWVDLDEEENAYVGSTTFSEAGLYQVRIHVMKESGTIHEHIETEIAVSE